MKTNVHSQNIPAHVIEEATSKLNELKELLSPYTTVGLTAKDRKRMLRLGPKTMDFVGVAFEIASNYSALLPEHISVKEFEVDHVGAQQLFSLQVKLESFLQKLNDLVVVAGSEALQAALAVYASVRFAHTQKVPGAKALYEKMKSKYPNVGRRSAKKEGPPAPVASE